MNFLAQKALDWLAHPKFFSIHGGRWGRMAAAVEGWKRTHIALVGFNGTYIPPEKGEEVGIFAIGPRLSEWSHLDIVTTVNVFLGAAIVCGLLIGLAGCFRLFSNRADRAACALACCVMAFLSFMAWDIYVFLGISVLALVPWLFHFHRSIFRACLLIGIFLCAVGAATANIFRSHAGTACLLMGIFLIATAPRWPISKRGIGLLIFFLGAALPYIARHHLLERRNNFLAQYPPTAYSQMIAQHGMWHPIYLGLGIIIPNAENITYDDQVAVRRAQELSPGVVVSSPEYEQILRSEVIRIFKERPLFVLEGMATKCLVLLFYLVLFANTALIRLWKQKRVSPEFLSVMLGLSFHSLVGLLVIPHPKYMLGFICLCLFLPIVARLPRENPPELLPARA